MTPGLWVTVVLGLLTVSVTLVVAYMHRRQMRQNEAFRQDPSLGLIPPPNAFVLFLRGKGLLLLVLWAFGYGAYNLIHGLRQQGPVTRAMVADIAIGVGSIVFGVTFFIIREVIGLIDRAVEVMKDMYNLHETAGKRTSVILELLARRADTAPASPAERAQKPSTRTEKP